ncbi:hypothetical protein MMC13_001163 [Lambiella insularis]|nr:hypothetical protein [Lambiella insularis]
MSSNARPQTTNVSGGPTTDKTFFEQQRETLVGEIAISLEHVLQNINKLNRSLEGVIAIGNEFGSVEALWSQFENVMAKDQEELTEVKDAGEGEEKGNDTEAKERYNEGADETMRPGDKA